MRELTLFFGGVDAGKQTAERIAKAGYNVVLYPGGLDEANTENGGNAVRLHTRTGFIRMAVQRGCPVLPMFCFGELEAVRAVAILPPQAATFLKRQFRISSTVFVGRWGTFVPARTPFNLIVGKPVATKMCVGGPELEEEVARVHAAFKMELRNIFEANKKRFEYADRDLVFTCEQRKSTRAGQTKQPDAE